MTRRGHIARFVALSRAASVLATAAPLWLAGCDREKGADRAEAGPTAPPPPLAVSFFGCDGVLRGPVCTYQKKTEHPSLTLWVETPAEADVTVALAGRAVEAKDRGIPGGRSLAVALPENPRGDLVVTSALGGASSTWSLSIAEGETCPAVDAARALRAEGKAEEALAALESTQKSDSPLCGGEELRTSAAILGYDRDDAPAGVERSRAALTQGRKLGDLAGVIRDVQRLSHLLSIKLHDFASAHRELDSADDIIREYPAGAPVVTFALGQLAFETGDLREALRRYDESEGEAVRLGMTRLLRGVLQEKADLLAYLGRYSEAVVTIETSLTDDDSDLNDCQRPVILGNVGWIRFLERRHAREEGNIVDFSDCSKPMEQALDIFRSTCPNPFLESITLLNLAIIAYEKGDLDEAEKRLREAIEKNPQPAEFAVDWTLDLEGRIALARGDARGALRVFQTLETRAVPSTEPALRATTGIADALAALGRDAQAIDAYRRAEDLLDERIRLIPVNAGQGAFLADKEGSARALVGLLLKRGETAAAFDAARRSRARMLWELERDDALEGLSAAQRAAWETRIEKYRALNEALAKTRAAFADAADDERTALAAQSAALETEVRSAIDDIYADIPRLSRREIAPLDLAEGEVALLFHPAREGMVGFAATRDGLVARALAPFDAKADPATLAPALLAPFETEIDGASRIRILAHGALRDVDFHALPWRGAPLLAHAAVVYALDLPRSDESAAERFELGALVVTDPTGNLSGARKTEKLARDHFERLGAEARYLGGREASRRAVLESLPRAARFHFAGHAEQSGRDGWASALLLASGERLTVGDILTLTRTPRDTVLLACESGTQSEGASAETLGLGQAFVVAGARTAVTASRKIDDAAAERYAALLYGNPNEDTVDAARAAQMELKDECPSCDWAAFRVFTP